MSKFLMHDLLDSYLQDPLHTFVTVQKDQYKYIQSFSISGLQIIICISNAKESAAQEKIEMLIACHFNRDGTVLGSFLIKKAAELDAIILLLKYKLSFYFQNISWTFLARVACTTWKTSSRGSLLISTGSRTSPTCTSEPSTPTTWPSASSTAYAPPISSELNRARSGLRYRHENSGQSW